MMVKIGRGSLGKESESRAGNGCHATESDRSGGPQIAVWEQMARRLTALSGALFVLLVLIAPVGAAESGESGSQSAYAFSLEAYAGRTLAYRLHTFGSIQVQGESERDAGANVELRAQVEVSLASPGEDGKTPFTLRFVQVRAEGFAEDLERALTGLTVQGVLQPSGALDAVDTPPVLAEWGIDMTDLVAGLFVPRPEQSIGVGESWRVPTIRQNLGSQRTRTMRLDGTYTRQGIQSWGGRNLESVTGRLRGSTTLREGALRTEVQEVGHIIAYIEPETGITAVSSFSVITTVETVHPSEGRLRSRVTLTTTLQLEPSASAAPGRPLADAAAGAPGAEPAPLPGLAAQDPLPPDGTGPTLPQREETILYHDPADRFYVVLPGTWQGVKPSLSLRTTTLDEAGGERRLFVHVLPLPSAGASALAVARSALTTYQETTPGFRLVDELQETSLDGEAAFRALYRYRDPRRGDVLEWAVFARRGDRAYYVQYAVPAAGDPAVAGVEFDRIVAGFRFGSSPGGAVSPAKLLESLTTFVDPQGRYTLLVPSLWPRIDVEPATGSATFAEIGERGYLTIFAQRGATGLTARQIIESWKTELSQEPGFKLIQDVSDAPLAGLEGVRLQYEWLAAPDSRWIRRMQAAVAEDTLFAIAVDYEASGYTERASIFERIFESFALLPSRAAAPSDGGLSQEGPAPPLSWEEARTARPETAAAAEPPPVEPPRSEQSHLVLGRIVTRYLDASGRLVEEGAREARVTIAVGNERFTALTDAEGYFFAPNLPPLEAGRLYVLDRVEGRMFGFSGSVTVTFENLAHGASGPQVAHLGTVTVTLLEGNALAVDVERGVASQTGQVSALDRFLELYPTGPWSDLVREVVHRGID